MILEIYVRMVAFLQTPHIVPLLTGAAIGAFFCLLVLSLLVRYAMIFAFAGTVAFVVILAQFPKSVSHDVVDAVIFVGLAAFGFMLFIYEFILWRQASRMRKIAQQSRLRHALRRGERNYRSRVY
jgi:uncharacterized membrane protein